MDADRVERPMPKEQVVETLNRLVLGVRQHRNPVGRLLYAIQRGERPELDDIGPILRELRNNKHFSSSTREMAAWALTRAVLTPDQQQDALAALKDTLENRYPRDHFKLFRALVRPATITAPLTMLFGISVGLMPWWQSILLMPLFALILHIVLLPLLLPVFQAIAISHGNRVRASCALALGELGSVENAGPLARALRDRSRHVRRAARDALMIRLPQLTTDHYGRLEMDIVPNLSRA